MMPLLPHLRFRQYAIRLLICAPILFIYGPGTPAYAVPPTVSLESAVGDTTTTSPFSVTVRFSEGVTGFEIADITVTNGTASNFVMVNDSVYTVDITPTADGLVTVRVGAVVAHNAAGEGNLDAEPLHIFYDGTSPEIVSLFPADDATNVAVDANLTLIFSDPVRAGSGLITVNRLSDDAVIEAVDVTDESKVNITGNIVTITLSNDLADGDTFYGTVSTTALVSHVGLPFPGISDNGTWNFTPIGGPTPKISVSPEILDFGSVFIDNIVQSPVPVVVKNIGTVDLTVSSIIVAPFEFALSTEPVLPFTLTPGDSATFTITFFSPPDPVLAGGFFVVGSDAGSGISSISLLGLAVAPQIAVSPNPVNFGTVATGSNAGNTVTIQNIDADGLSIGSIVIDDPSTFFSIDISGLVFPVILNSGDMIQVPAHYTPTSPGAHSAVVSVTSNAAGGTGSTALTGAAISPTEVHFTQGFGSPGGIAIANMEVILNAPTSAFQLKIQPDYPELVTLEGIINDFENEGFSIASSTDEITGCTTLLFFSTEGDTIQPGHYTILEFVYTISEAAEHLACIELQVSDVIFSSPDSEPLDIGEIRSGQIKVGVQGDVAGGAFGDGDGTVNILDIVKTIKYILGLLPVPTDTFVFWLVDVQPDGEINVLDLMAMINAYLDSQSQTVKQIPASPATVNLGGGRIDSEGQFIPLLLESEGGIAAAQATFTFNPALLSIGTPRLTGRTQDMKIEYHVEDGVLQIIVYSTAGRSIPAGSDAAVLIPVRLQGSQDEAPMLILDYVLLADVQAQSIPVTIGTNSIKIAGVPATFSLGHNAPNPFNPSTQIQYEVPEQAHITLAVYNILGQEVARLVDTVQPAGRYTVTWHATDTQGRSAASGIYLYRLTSSTGFADVKRMLLLK